MIPQPGQTLLWNWRYDKVNLYLSNVLLYILVQDWATLGKSVFWSQFRSKNSSLEDRLTKPNNKQAKTETNKLCVYIPGILHTTLCIVGLRVSISPSI